MYFMVSHFLCVILVARSWGGKVNARSKRFLLTSTNTQYGVFLAASVPVEEGSLVNVGWFMEASYYPVANATYWAPLYDDFTVSSGRQTREEYKFSRFTRETLYLSIEKFLIRGGRPGRACLLRAICESAFVHLHQNGLVGDLLHVVLTPSSSEEEELDDEFYEAEYLGLLKDCNPYVDACPENPLEYFSVLL